MKSTSFIKAELKSLNRRKKAFIQSILFPAFIMLLMYYTYRQLIKLGYPILKTEEEVALFMLTGMSMFLGAFTGLSNTASLLTIMKDRRLTHLWLTWGYSTANIYAGVLVSNIVFTWGPWIILAVIMYLIAGVIPPPIRLPFFILTATVIITLLSAIGLLIAAIATSSREVAPTVSLVTNILVFTSSAIIPPEMISEPINLVVKCNPLSYATEIARHAIFAEYLDVWFILERLLYLAVIALILTIVSVKLYEKSVVKS